MKKIQFLLFVIFFALALLLGSIIPITQDESYYLSWAHNLSFGYFDHPPMIAWVAIFGRYGTAMLFGLQSVILFRTFRYFCDLRTSVLSTFLISTSIGALANGFLLTPDAPLIFFWVCATHELIAALVLKNPKRLLWLGLFCGFGLLSKYTFVLFPLSLIVFAFFYRKDWFRRKELYLSGAIAFAIFLPNLVWNFNHDWITVRFQAKHGMDAQRPTVATNQYPDILPLTTEMPEFQIGKDFEKFEEPTEEKPKREVSFSEKAIFRVLEFVGGQLMVWGILLVAVFPMLYAAIKQRVKREEVISAGVVLALTPLLFFGILSPFTKIEANWPAMYIVGAGIIFAPFVASYIKSIRIAGAINILIALVIGLTSLFATSKYIRKRNRLANETFGYNRLAQILNEMAAKPLADTYQLTAMLKTYRPKVPVSQLPKVNRDSQFTLNQIPFNDFARNGSFSFVSSEAPPPHVVGFRISNALQFRICSNNKMLVFDQFKDPSTVCLDYERKWFFYEYVRI